MNYLDPLDVASAGAATPPPAAQEQSLNDEVSQVIGQLNRFWGGFRKQSETALATARKDFSEVVTQAQVQMHRYSASSEVTSETTSQPTASTSKELDSENRPPLPTPTEQREASSSSPSPSPPPAQTFFSRLQAALPPNIAATVQNNIPESIKSADFTHISSTLATEFQRVQGVTRAQAEEYVHKSEALLREAVKEAGEVLKDAVKVIPPEEPGSSGLIWDGSDMWMLPTPISEASPVVDKGKGKASSTLAVATRAEALLKRLKHDSAILRHDPEADSATKELYGQWFEAEVTNKGGIDGEEWSKRIAAVLADGVDGPALKANEVTLVPSELTKDAFWFRFFFRAHQISQEEIKRKAVIRGSLDNDEDFSWEDEDEDETSESKSLTPSASTSKPGPKQQTSSESNTPAPSSPRDSSEDSYDVVSSGNVSEAKAGQAKKAVAESDEGDSDWE